MANRLGLAKDIKKWSPLVGRGYKGKGSTVMAICDGTGRPTGFSLHGADQHETQCVEDVLESVSKDNIPKKIFGDKAYDSQGLQSVLALKWGVDLSAPLRRSNKQIISDKTIPWQKGRWKIERLFAWIKSFRRTNTRWEYHPESFLSWIFLSASLILFFRF